MNTHIYIYIYQINMYMLYMYKVLTKESKYSEILLNEYNKCLFS